MRRVLAVLLQLLESYLIITALALTAGLVFPQRVIAIAPYTTLLLQGIFFLAGLKLDLTDLRAHLRHPTKIVLATVLMLVVFPIATYPVVRALAPDAALGILLLAAMPSAMSAPLFALLAGGSESLALTLTVTTSALAPVTIPLVIQFLAGATVAVPMLAMFRNLAFTIFLPIAIAQVIRRGLRARIGAASFAFKPLSVLLLGLLIAAITATHADRIRASLTDALLPVAASLIGFTIATHVVGYHLALHRGCRERVTYAVCLAYMNFTLAIYLAGRFFPDPGTILTTALSLVTWSLGFIPFRAWALRCTAARGR